MDRKIFAITLFILMIHAITGSVQAQNPDITAQTGHNRGIFDVVFSADSRLLVSYAGSEIILWDVNSGRQIRTMNGHEADIKDIAISADGKYLVSCSWDKTVKIWDVSSGEIVRSLTPIQGSNATAVCFGPQDNLVLVGLENGSIATFEINNPEIHVILTGHLKSVYEITFSSDGKWMASSAGNDETKLWDFEKRQVLKTLAYGGKSVSFSNEGHLLAVGGKDVVLFDPQSGVQLKTYASKMYSVENVRFSADDKALMISESWDPVRLVSLATGEILREYGAASDEYDCGALSPDQRFIAAGFKDKGEITIFDFKTASRVRSLRGYCQGVTICQFSPDGRFILSGSQDARLTLWELASGRPLRTFTGHSLPIVSAQFSSDGKYVLSGGELHELKLWDAATGKEEKTFRTDEYDVFTSALSPDMQYAVAGGVDHRVKLFNVSSGWKITNFTPRKWDWETKAVTFSPDGKYVLSGAWDRGFTTADKIHLWNIETGYKVRSYGKGLSDEIVALDFSPDGRYFVSGGTGQTIMWEVESGSVVREFDGASRDVCYSKDGKYLVMAGYYDNLIRLYDAKSGQLLNTMKGHVAYVNAVSVSADNRFIVSGSNDGTTRIWDRASGKEICRLITSPQGDWVIVTNDGYFDASHRGGHLVNVAVGSNVFAIDQFAMKNNRPDIILKKLGLASEARINHYYAQFKKRLRRAGFTEAQLSAGFQAPKSEILHAEQKGKFVDLRFRFTDENYDLKRYQVFVNDVPLFGAYGKDLSGRSATLNERIELTTDENKIEVSAVNEAGAESYRALTGKTYSQKIKGNLYFLGFGVSRYKNQNLNLKYAHKDALDLSSLLQRVKRHFANVYVKTFLNEQVTVANIKRAKSFLAGATVDDTFILFIAGHGMHDEDSESTYYYLTHETDLANLSKTAARFGLIEDLMQGIKPRRKLYLMDTCESGELDENKEQHFFAMADSRSIRARTTRGFKKAGSQIKPQRRSYLLERDRYIYNDLIRRSGAIVFSSSQGGEFSYEMDSIQNGLFTEAVIAALTSTKADQNGDNLINSDELRSFVTKAVAERSGDLQHPTVDRDNIFQRVEIPVIR